MKISKVNHTRVGVGIQKLKQKGILYYNPNNDKKDIVVIEEHIKQLNQKAQNLYAILNRISFTEEETGNKMSKECNVISKELIVEFNKQFLDLLKIVYTNDKIEAQIKKISGWNGTLGISKEKIAIIRENKLIKKIVDGCVKNSLRKSVLLPNSLERVFLKDIIEKLLEAFFSEEGFQKAYKQIPQEEIRILLCHVNQDYAKKQQIAKIVKSIERQNVKVVCKETENGPRLMLSVGEHNKKQEIFEFIKEYANVDKENQEKMLIHFMALMCLFYYGEDTYKNVSQYSLRDLEAGRPDNKQIFSEKAKSLIEQKNQQNGKTERKGSSDKIREELRREIAERYRNSVKAEGITKQDRFWLEYIENVAEKILLKNKVGISKLFISYLYHWTYKEFQSFIAMKYIDLGKAVYHFAVPNLKELGKEAIIGEVLPEYQKGITSFDYEYIKAEESLSRELAVYIAFAVHNFDQAVRRSERKEKRKKNQDILLLTQNELAKYPGARKRCLQFFGGESCWQDSLIIEYKEDEVVEEFKEKLAVIRNGSFHYTGTIDCKESDNFIIEELLEGELKKVGQILYKKYYSNNVLMFYGKEKIDNLIQRLYKEHKGYPAQIPAFHHIINKANLPEFMLRYIKMNYKKKLSSGNADMMVMEKYKSTLFFLLKEIYYNEFLHSKDLKERFKKALNQFADLTLKQDEKREEARENFIKRMKEIDKDNTLSFGEICQYFMTDYSMQNQNKEKTAAYVLDKAKTEKLNKTNKKKKVYKRNNKDIYQHFRMLLYLGIKEAFYEYLKEKKEQFEFLREPEYHLEMPAEEEFCKNRIMSYFDYLRESIKKDTLMSSWYIAAHFLNQRQLNHLIGSIKNYIQYIKDIDNRANNTRNRKKENQKEKLKQYTKLLELLEFCKLFCGKISNIIRDYFDNEEEYEQYLLKYVDIGKGSKALQAFCNQPVKQSPSGRIGIYYDGTNPILNRNVVLAKLYGSTEVLSRCMDKVSETEIRDWYKTMQELKKVFEKGACEKEEEYEKVRQFQNNKNRIELVDAVVYTEIINDLLSQLIAWANMRERDLMYFQLGFHYIRLYYGNSIEKESKQRCLKGEEVDIKDGALLYQIISMYTYELPIYQIDENGTVIGKKNVQIGDCVILFANQYCKDKGILYDSGLEFFEDIKEHDDIVKFRNSIAHFKYFTNMDQSILDMYSEMYDRALSYDLKLKKSVSYILKNILLKYFVITDVDFSSSKLKIIKEKGKEYRKVKATQITLARQKMRSDRMAAGLYLDIMSTSQYGKLKKMETTVSAREEKFLDQLYRILGFSIENKEKI